MPLIRGCMSCIGTTVRKYMQSNLGALAVTFFMGLSSGWTDPRPALERPMEGAPAWIIRAWQSSKRGGSGLSRAVALDTGLNPLLPEFSSFWRGKCYQRAT